MSGVNNVRKGRQAREQRQAEASERQAKRDQLTDKQHLSNIIKAGYGHTEEALLLSISVGAKQVFRSEDGTEITAKEFFRVKDDTSNE